MTLTKQYLESNVSVRHLPGEYRLLGALGGVPIAESQDLRYDEMYLGRGAQGLVVGDIAHFMYRMKMLDLNQQAREVAADHIRRSARKILGEEFELRS